MKLKTRKVFGKYIVADPAICHGQLTFLGTRIFVAHVLEDAASGMNWDEIIKNWHGSITREAIAEALELSPRALLDHIDEYADTADSR